MGKRITFLAGYFFYWYVLMVLARVGFLLFHRDQSGLLDVADIFNTFRYGAALDLSISGYLSIVPGILVLIFSLSNAEFLRKSVHFYTLVLLFLFSLLVVTDINLYTYWGFRLDATPLFYMNNLKAMTASAEAWVWMVGILFTGILTFVFYRLYLLVFRKLLIPLPHKTVPAIMSLLLTILLFLPIRGGVGISSVTISTAYFSHNQFANHAAINPIWNVAFSLTESKDLGKKYIYYEPSRMEEFVAPLIQGSGDVIPVLNDHRPNIILIIVESLTAKAVGVTSEMKGITPELDSLAKNGILFDRIFASADRTDKGLAAVLSGYPSLPASSPLKYQKLTEKLNFLPGHLKKAGYHCSFIYGGTLEFANYRSYLVQSGIDRMISDEDFSKEELVSKWGAWDHTVFERALAETPDGATGFFKTILTLTSHEPFAIPTQPLLKGNDTETAFLNSLHYTDGAIGDFIRESRKRDWWKNTLVVIIADHGSKLPGNSGNDDFLRQHIPMIWTGGAVAKTDTVIHTLASQTDLAATLLAQLGLNHDGFLFSKNILSPTVKPYAFFTFNEGIAYLTPNHYLVYNSITDSFTHSSPSGSPLMEQQAKAYLQLLYSDFFGVIK